MAEKNSGFFQNPFSNKKEDVKPKENVAPPKEDVTNAVTADTDGIVVEEEGDGAIQHLIYYSFYPLTCMVPLGEDFITINEKVPDLMKIQSNDNLLQETIKTFHSLMQEKDDEILNLRRQLKDDDSSLIKMTSEIIQTDLTLSACEEMERQLNELSEGLPEKEEKIHQLELEKARLEETIQGGDLVNTESKVNHLEEELNEALKNLVESEEGNQRLSNEITDLKQSYQELKWQLEEVNDLKVEVELAKIQTEDDMLKLKSILKEKLALTDKLKEQIKHEDQIDGIITAADPSMTTKEFDMMRENYERQISNLEKNLKEATDCLKKMEGKECRFGNESKSEKALDLPELIEKVKENIFASSGNDQIIDSLCEIFQQHADKLGSSDMQAIEELTTIAMASHTDDRELRKIVEVMGSIQFNETGDINGRDFMQSLNDDSKKEYTKNKARNELQQDAFGLGLLIKVNESLLKVDVEELRNEYSKLEIILNLLNKSYPLTHVANLNKTPRNEVLDKILRMRNTIFDICMHSFWENIFHQPRNVNIETDKFSINASDLKVFNEMIYPSFSSANTFLPLLLSIVNVREVLLVGVATNGTPTPCNVLMAKIHGVGLNHDLTNHLLPRFPKEVRYMSMARSIEDVVVHDANLLDNLSPDFLNFLQESQTDFLAVLLDILLTLDFEDDIFLPTVKSNSAELKLSKLSVSVVSQKTEISVVKVSIISNAKSIITRKLVELENVLNFTRENVTPDSFKSKNENELIRLLIDKKEKLLKIIFTSKFHPVCEKLSLNKTNVFMSCVTKDCLGVDFWIKILLEKYCKKQLSSFNDLTVDEMTICVTRLHKALQTISPAFTYLTAEFKKSKSLLAPMIVKYRTKLRCVMQECIFAKRSSTQLSKDIIEVIKEGKESQIGQSFETLKQMFEIREVENTKLEDVLQRLYDIDCEIYPGDFDQDMEKREFASIPRSEMLEEIMKLRLSIAAYVMSPYEWTSSSEKTSVDYKSQFKTLKDIESIMMKVEPEMVDDNFILSETKLLKIIIGKLKQKKKIDSEKLKNCFFALKKVENGLNNTKFDATESVTQFEKIVDSKERVAMVLSEAEHLLERLAIGKTSKLSRKKLSDNYFKIDELLGDIESKMESSDDKPKNVWAYAVLDKTEEILKLIPQKESEKHDRQFSVREHVMNNLDDIKQSANESADWRTNCFNRLNNLVRKLNSRVKNRNIQTSGTYNSDMSANFQDEKAAFDKAFNQLEDRFKEIELPSRKGNERDNEYDLESKSEDELKSIILALEKELSNKSWTKSDETEAKSWLNSRTREELITDSNALLHKTAIMKVENLLGKRSEKEGNNDRRANENPISQFEDDINAKLAKYEELCDSVEKLKVPQQPIVRRTDPSSQLTASYNSGHRRNVVSPYDQQMNVPVSYSPTLKAYSSQTCLRPNDDEDIDEYFQQRLDELQRAIKNPRLTENGSLSRRTAPNGSDIVVDGFELEDERTPRYYSMKLQDIQHERKEDEMGALMHHTEKHRSDLLAENENLQQQLYVRTNIQENQNLRMASLEKTEDILKRRIAALEAGNPIGSQNILNDEEVQIMRQDRQRLTKALTNIKKRMDQLNSEAVDLLSSNTNFQHENHNLIIKNQYLERSMHKLEEIYEDVVEQLSKYKSQADKTKYFSISDIKDSPLVSTEDTHKSRLNERDKLELVKKLDILDQQNKLLRKHCEKLNGELSVLTRKCAEAQDKSDTYLQQNQQLTEVLDKIEMSKGRSDSSSVSIAVREKDVEIKNLRNKILHLETKLISSKDSPSIDRLKQELVSNKDKEIMRLAEQVGCLQDRVDETRAQLEVKEYENQKLHSLTKQLQNQVNDDAYFPPPGYKLVKDS